MSRDLRIVIVGGGHVGYCTARRSVNRGHDIVIIEKDEGRVEFLSDQYTACVIHGNGGHPLPVVSRYSHAGSRAVRGAEDVTT